MVNTEPTTDAPEPTPAPVTKRAQDLNPGDVIRTGDPFDEVRCVEPDLGTNCVVILFVGGAVDRVLAHKTYELADAATAEAWRAEQASARERARLASFLVELGERVGDGMPPPTYNLLSIMYEVDDRAGVEKAAELYGVPATDIKDQNGYTRFEIRRGRHQVEFYCRNRPAQEVTV